MAYCGHCGKYVKDGTEICPECGCYTIAKSGTKQIASSGANQVASTESKQFAFCDKCGQKIDATATVCSHCGCTVQPLRQQSNATVSTAVSSEKDYEIASIVGCSASLIAVSFMIEVISLNIFIVITLMGIIATIFSGLGLRKESKRIQYEVIIGLLVGVICTLYGLIKFLF